MRGTFWILGEMTWNDPKQMGILLSEMFLAVENSKIAAQLAIFTGKHNYNYEFTTR